MSVNCISQLIVSVPQKLRSSEQSQLYSMYETLLGLLFTFCGAGILLWLLWCWNPSVVLLRRVLRCFKADLTEIYRHRLEALVKEEPYANGLAVISTNDYAFCPKLSYAPLQGTRVDFRSMDDAFMSLNFARFPVQNGSSLVLKTVMRVAASFQSYPESYQRFAFVFSGHGSDNDRIVMQDGEEINLEDLIQYFQPGTAPKIGHWPKMYFIDACRGQEELNSVLATKGGGQTRLHLKVPEKGNILIAFCTAPRCKAYERKAKGGCWLPFLARKLKELDASVMDVLTAVNEEVLACFQDQPGGKIQQPELKGSLNCHVFLLREAIAAKAKHGKV